MNLDRCQLYLISPEQFVLEHFVEQVKQAFAGGDIGVFQLRMKHASDAEILAAAEKIMPLCSSHGTAFIINDHPGLAKQIDADGVHIGIEDYTAKEAREIVGPDMAIGVSCYGSRDRAMEAGEQGADYVAFGQFYQTQTKPPRGRPTPDILEWWSTYTVLPCVAIGGIKPDNCKPLVEAGADFIAVLTGVWDHPNGPEAAVKGYNQVLNAT